ncbi:iron-containing redox enzyme family protein [Gammaproteobacteria bacterium]|nr:iron-containing redox enzyme family protein [Gammaproteobacteria bacterium]
MSFYKRLIAETEAERQDFLAAPIIARVFSGDISLDNYVGFLAQAYHHVKHTVPLMMAVGSRLPENKEWMRESLAEYIEEEIGHQEWVLNDIFACGYDKEFVRSQLPHATTELMVAYAYDTVMRGNPMGFFGMVHVLEGTSINLADKVAGAVKETLGLPANSFSYLISHGSLDQGHVEFFENLMNKIDDIEDEKAIIHACRIFYKLYGDIFRALDDEHNIPKLAQS